MTERAPQNAQTLTEDDMQIIRSLRENSIKQVDQWRRIPCLTVKANGITGYNPRFSNAYRYGYWEIGDLGGKLYVDLDSGEIVKRIIPEDKKRVEMLSAKDEDVTTVLLSNSDYLNPEIIIKLLEEHAKLPSSYPNKAHQDSERRKEVLKYSIFPIYLRNKKE